MKTHALEKTIRCDFELKGIGLHSGQETRVRFKSAGEGTGLSFHRKNNGQDSASETMVRPERRTSILLSHGRIDTVEHLLSAIYALGISNLDIDVDGDEIPAMDGSALPFVKAFKDAGVVTQTSPREICRVDAPIFVGRERAAIAIIPYEGFKVTYTLDYGHPSIKSKTVTFEIDENTFVRELAPARTFCTAEEADALRAEGYGKGANYENTLVMGPKGPLNTKLRFEDECVRHKILDLIGDLALYGKPIQGHVIAIRSGHELNRQLIEKLKQKEEPHD